MKWRKLGKIFDPAEYPSSSEYVGFAQSPQTLEFEEFVRIYFSTRKMDSTGKFLSHISFVDFDKEFKKVVNISTKSIIELGDLGCFDEHGIFPINPLRHNDKITAYTCGWSRRVSVSVETSIGLAQSYDGGLTFEKFGKGPIMGSFVNEPFLVGDAFVKIFDDRFHMWYIYGIKWAILEGEQMPDRVYKIGYATSLDGINWLRDSMRIVADKLNEEECQALPTVEYFNNKYNMFFCYRYATGFRKSKERSYRIGYAYSSDLQTWTRDDDQVGIDVSDVGWDSEMICYPHIFICKEHVYMLYNGNEFGRFGFGLAVLED